MAEESSKSVEKIEKIVKNLIANAASTEEASASMQMLASAIEECTKDTEKLVAMSKKQNEETSKFKLM